MEYNFLLNIAVILLFTKSFGLISKSIHLPQVVGALLAGLILGPTVLNFIHMDSFLNHIAEIGVILLLFEAGMETDLNKLKDNLKASLIIGFLGVFVPLIFGYYLSRYFGFEILKSIFIGVILTATSISITIESLQEMGKLKSKVATAILGAAIVDDILGITILSIVINFSSYEGAVYSVIFVILVKILIFGTIAYVSGYFVYKLFQYVRKHYGPCKRLTIYAISYCFLLSYLAELMGIASITGAYISGLVLCNNKSLHYIEKEAKTLSYLFFSPIFFASIGISTNLSYFNNDFLMFTILLVIVAILTKFVGCSIGGYFCGYNKSDSLKLGIGMISRGEVALIVLRKGMELNIINKELFSSIVIMVVVTTLATPLLLSIAYKNQ